MSAMRGTKPFESGALSGRLTPWDVFRGVKTPGLTPVAPSEQYLFSERNTYAINAISRRNTWGVRRRRNRRQPGWSVSGTLGLEYSGSTDSPRPVPEKPEASILSFVFIHSYRHS